MHQRGPYGSYAPFSTLSTLPIELAGRLDLLAPPQDVRGIANRDLDSERDWYTNFPLPL